MKYPRKAAALVAAAAAALAMSAQGADPAKPPTAQQTMGAQAMGVKFGGFFNDQQKQAARKAFSQKYAKAKACPPGLQKKGKSCESPWDTRYWAVGQALQPAVTVYPVSEIASVLPTPPKGYEYVRAADDILLIASQSKLVVDIIEHVTS
jgi:Ni/Co efflux regulator RcnB